MRDDDFELADSIFIRLCEKQELGKESLSKEEQIVITVWHASGIIGNGGLLYFFEQELDSEKTAGAYEEIGSSKCAELLRLFVSVFPENLSREERVGFIQSKTEIFDNLSSAFWEADEKTVKRIADYIRAHRPKISVLT